MNLTTLGLTDTSHVLGSHDSVIIYPHVLLNSSNDNIEQWPSSFKNKKILKTKSYLN